MSSSAGIWGRIKNSFHKDPPKTRLSQEQVVEIAEAYLASKGDIPLREPYGVGVIIEKNQLTWHVCDLANMRGGNFHMHIADATGEVVKTWATPR